MTGHDTEMADRVAIHNLLMEYGAALDRRDFDAFGKLFGEDGRYETQRWATVGAEAGTRMRSRYEDESDNDVTIPNFHLFFNEVIWFETPDRARSTSACIFIKTPDPATGQLAIDVGAAYDDELVREKDGSWRFARRTLRPLSNGPLTPR